MDFDFYIDIAVRFWNFYVFGSANKYFGANLNWEIDMVSKFIEKNINRFTFEQEVMSLWVFSNCEYLSMNLRELHWRQVILKYVFRFVLRVSCPMMYLPNVDLGIVLVMFMVLEEFLFIQIALLLFTISDTKFQDGKWKPSPTNSTGFIFLRFSKSTKLWHVMCP